MGKLFSKTIFKSSSESPIWRKIEKFEICVNLVEGRVKIMQIRAFQNARTKQRKLVFSSSFQDLLHISQGYFQPTFYLHLRFLSILCTLEQTAMFRTLLTR